MRIPIPFAPLLLVACGTVPDGNAPQNRAGGTPAPEPVATNLPDGGAIPRPGDLRTFTDWTTGCDNIGTCKAVALHPEDSPQSNLLMSVERGAGPAGAITIRFQTNDPIPLPLTALVDGQPIARGGKTQQETTLLTGSAATALAKAIAEGRQASVTDATGQNVGTVSLSGASAALRWIDAAQGRAGTTGAVVARGKRPDTRATTPAPVVRAVAPAGEAALLDPALVTTMRRTAGCDTGDMPEVEAKPLGHGGTLALVPCWMGAYNMIQAVFVVRSGKAVPAAFDAPSGIEGDSPTVGNVVNGGFEDGILTSYAKGRGIGDCGIDRRFAWDGNRFRLIEQSEMEECRGSIDMIRTWTARVVR